MSVFNTEKIPESTYNEQADPSLAVQGRNQVRASETGRRALDDREGGLTLYQQEHLAHNIRKYRLLAGLTQVQLAKRMYVSSQNIYKWETGKITPSVENLYLLSRALEVSADVLLSDTEDSAAPAADD